LAHQVKKSEAVHETKIEWYDVGQHFGAIDRILPRRVLGAHIAKSLPTTQDATVVHADQTQIVGWLVGQHFWNDKCQVAPHIRYTKNSALQRTEGALPKLVGRSPGKTCGRHNFFFTA